ncbi:MAG: hypothetical protein AAFR28_19535, partial [Pseudomonadota bacterium]
ASGAVPRGMVPGNVARVVHERDRVAAFEPGEHLGIGAEAATRREVGAKASSDARPGDAVI